MLFTAIDVCTLGSGRVKKGKLHYAEITKHYTTEGVQKRKLSAIEQHCVSNVLCVAR